MLKYMSNHEFTQAKRCPLDGAFQSFFIYESVNQMSNRFKPSGWLATQSTKYGTYHYYRYQGVSPSTGIRVSDSLAESIRKAIADRKTVSEILELIQGAKVAS